MENKKKHFNTENPVSSGPEVLADDRCSAFLETVLGIGGDPAEIVGYAHGSDHRISVKRAHGIDNGLAEGEQCLLGDDRHDLASIGEMTLLSAVTALKEKLNAPSSKKLYFRANVNRKTWDKRLASPIMTRSPFRR